MPPHEEPKEASKKEIAKGEAARIEAAKIAGLRRPIAIRNLEFVAHLRRQLFSHHWSFVYAASLKHAPKRIRFLQNGTVETDLKGERWYWRALDGRRVALRTLTDESQPAITLDFDEGYTNFRYALADQSVAVQGAPLDTIAEAPDPSNSGAAASENAPKTLEEALLSYPWSWEDGSGKSVSGVRFAKNKSVQVAGRTSFWNVTGPRTVHVESANGDQTDLLFDTTFSVYTDGNQISGARENPDSDTVPRVTSAEATAVAPSANFSEGSDGPPKSLEEALTSYEWTWGKGTKVTIFHPNGEMTGLVNKTQWKITGPRTILMTRCGKTFDVNFNEALSEYSSHLAKGRRGRRLTE